MNAFAKSLVYGAVEVMTAGRGVPRRIGGEVIRFPARWSRYYQSDYEPETFRFLRERCGSGNIVLDIGAHVGLFSVVTARLVGPGGRVFSFEPTPGTREILERTVRLNGLGDRIEVRDEAVTGSSGTARFFETGDPGSNANSLVASTNRHRHEIRVQTTSIDDFASSRSIVVNCVKIDAEGNELAVLQGGERVLREQRPAIALALHPSALQAAGGSLEQIWRLLEAGGMMVTAGGRPLDEKAFCGREELFDVQCLPVSP
jgi:FkbM family methyltransferase